MAMRVRDLMTSNVITVGPEDHLLTVQELMWDNDIRHLPVVDADSEILGLISHRDLIRWTHSAESNLPLSAQTDLLRSTRAEDVMVRDLLTTEADEDIRRAAQLMFENKFGCLLVTTGGRLSGILTESDFVRLMAEGE